ncbi:MAG TPA: DUF6588 family protein [Candidatus Krumholzibacteria bacterium]|nr:DUF6588 family protein [Candidatus Krumholzibacteria bacterium]
MSIRSTAALAAALLMLPVAASAQLEENLSSYTENNATGYLEPFRDTISAGLGSGLFTTAEIPRSRPYFQLGMRAMLVQFSDDDRTFEATAEDYFPGTGTYDAPTVIGDTDPDPVAGPGGTSFQFPGGLDIDRLPIAAPQLSVGGFLGTEAMVRFFTGEFGDDDIGDISLFGIGLRHSVSQYVPASPVSIAASVMYQTFEIGDGLVDFSQTSLGVQASRRFPVVEPYAGLALHMSSMSSEYEFDATGDPETLEVDFDDETNVQLTLGATLHLLVFRLNGELGVGDQTTYTLGLSLGI